MGKLASLSSGLLARKGQARPAMRPQGFPGYTQPLDDLGWNDMGAAAVPLPPVSPPVLPPVLVERAALATAVTPDAAPPVRTVSVATATRIERDTLAEHDTGGKAAFTLRLDAARHLRLRLASATAGRSSQALMIEALDALIVAMPEVETLVAQLPPPAARKRKGNGR